MPSAIAKRTSATSSGSAPSRTAPSSPSGPTCAPGPATVTWSLTPQGTETHVRLSAEIERAPLRDRVLLALGGEAWLERAFARAIGRLALVAV